MRVASIRRLSFLVLTFVPLAFAQGTYTQIDVPGATLTHCAGIDSHGNITGFYYTLTSVSGFYLSDGIFTTINNNGQNTTLGQLNDVGQVVGFSFATQGFVYDVQSQTFTDVRVRNGYSTTLTSINDAGVVVGYYYMAPPGITRGFELTNLSYIDVDPPNTDNVQLYGISTAGGIFGLADSTRTHAEFNFSYTQGAYNKVYLKGPSNALAFGANPAGNAIVGVYVPSTGVAAGFVYQNQTLTTLQFPGSSDTVATAINSVGQVVGYFFDASGSSHGFLWTPPADTEKGH